MVISKDKANILISLYIDVICIWTIKSANFYIILYNSWNTLIIIYSYKYFFFHDARNIISHCIKIDFTHKIQILSTMVLIWGIQISWVICCATKSILLFSISYVWRNAHAKLEVFSLYSIYSEFVRKYMSSLNLVPVQWFLTELS